jgi:RNA recognition motif-containing protein
MEIFVGNLAPGTTEEDLLAIFKPFGEVRSAEVKRELFTGVSKGFGFVEMPGRQHSLAAIAGLNGKDLNGQPLRVNEAMAPRAGNQRRRHR